MKKIFLLLVMVFSFGEMFANNDFAHVFRKTLIPQHFDLTLFIST